MYTLSHRFSFFPIHRGTQSLHDSEFLRASGSSSSRSQIGTTISPDTALAVEIVHHNLSCHLFNRMMVKIKATLMSTR